MLWYAVQSFFSPLSFVLKASLMRWGHCVHVPGSRKAGIVSVAPVRWGCSPAAGRGPSGQQRAEPLWFRVLFLCAASEAVYRTAAPAERISQLAGWFKTFWFMTCICYGHITWNVKWKDTVAAHTHWLEMNGDTQQYIIPGQQQLKALKPAGGSSSQAQHGEMIGEMGSLPWNVPRNEDKWGAAPRGAAWTIWQQALCEGNQSTTETQMLTD